MVRLVLSTLLVALFFANVVHAKDGENSSISLTRFFNNYDKYLELSEAEQALLEPVYQLGSKEVSPDEVTLSFDFEGESFEILPNAEGKIDFFPTLEMLKANPTIDTNQPKGTLSLTLTIGVSLSTEQEQSVDDMHDAVHEAWKLAKGFVRGGGLFGSRHTSIIAMYDRSCLAPVWTLCKGDGYEKEYDATDAIDFGKKNIRNTETISFSCTPTGFILG